VNAAMRQPTTDRATRQAPSGLSHSRASARGVLADSRDHVCVGAIAAAHGIKGEVKIKAFTVDPKSVGAYGPLLDETGTRAFALSGLRPNGESTVIARIDGVADRNAAEALRGLRLYAPRSALPPAGEGEYYHHDLIGLDAVLASGEFLGKVIAVDNFGAGDVIEIKPDTADSLVLPFTDETVPTVDLAAGRIVVVLPQGLDDEPVGERS
jgi:16S rRNA processing protein RimM